MTTEEENQEEQVDQSQEQAQPEVDFNALLADPELATVLADPVALKELVSKGSDYTQKTQALADEKRTLAEDLDLAKQHRELMNIFADPTQRQIFLRDLQAFEQGQSAPAGLPSDIDLDDLTDNERKILNHANQQLAASNKQLAEMRGVLEQVKPMVDRTMQTERLQEATAKAKQLYQIDISGPELDAAMKTLGTSDPLHAAAHLAATKPAKTTKPATAAAHGDRVAAMGEASGSALFNLLRGNPGKATGR